jgi:hypothetical protein
LPNARTIHAHNKPPAQNAAANAAIRFNPRTHKCGEFLFSAASAQKNRVVQTKWTGILSLCREAIVNLGAHLLFMIWRWGKLPKFPWLLFYHISIES